MAQVASRILVVDDDDGIRDFIRTFLVDEGYTAATASNGREALQVAEQFRPHLILVDLRMPLMGGIEFVGAYRQQSGATAKIIALSAADDQISRQARRIVDDVLAKPFDLADLLDTVARNLR
jgi:CheY-like chemotaxis protein